MEMIKPTEKYYISYTEAIKEYEENNVTTYDFLQGDKEHVLKKINDFHTGDNLPENYVKATYLWFVNEGEFLGEVSIRHALINDLLRFGGNIGYGIRYSSQNKGLGTKMLALALEYAKNELKLKKVLITCNDTNIASARIIEKNGGVLQDKIVNKIAEVEFVTRRYWINVK